MSPKAWFRDAVKLRHVAPPSLSVVKATPLGTLVDPSPLTAQPAPTVDEREVVQSMDVVSALMTSVDPSPLTVSCYED